MPTCPSCGVQALPAASFCAACGERLALEPRGPGEDPLLGRVVHGTYLIQEKIGSGGMGDVYRAIHRGLGAPVAMKLIKRALLGDAAMVHRFEREARAASKLRHPNVVSVTDFGVAEDGALFMVMECLVGKSLARVIADDAPLPDPRAIDIGAQILAALAEAHAHGILHRDLKPENVVIESRRDAPDAVKVLDFGIAKVLGADAPSSTLTQAGLVCGTPGYMSPEQLRNEELDARSDLFAAGMVLYEMLTQKLPFDAKTPWELLHRHLTEAVPTPSARAGRPITPALERLVLRSVSASRSERPGSAEAMRDELLSIPLPAGTRRSGTAVLAPRLAPAPLAAAQPPPPTPSPASPPPPAAAWDPAVLEVAARELAEYLGPLARVVVRRVSSRAPDAATLYDLLAAEIPSEPDRAAFRRRLSSRRA